MEDLFEEKRRKRQKLKFKRRKALAKKAAILLSLGLFLFFIIDRYLVSIVLVEGSSMNDTLYDGDRILISKLDKSSGAIKRGDIIMFRGKDNRDYIKRVVALAGDLVEIRDGKVFLNGILLNEDYLHGDYTRTYRTNSWYIEENCVFVLGDNRDENESKDSRIFGSVNMDSIIGKMIRSLSGR